MSEDVTPKLEKKNSLPAAQRAGGSYLEYFLKS